MIERVTSCYFLHSSFVLKYLVISVRRTKWIHIFVYFWLYMMTNWCELIILLVIFVSIAFNLVTFSDENLVLFEMVALCHFARRVKK